jgi:hypothetical protein
MKEVCVVPQPDINLWGVVVGAMINMVIGAVWYSPLLFSKPWMKATGKSAEDMRRDGLGSGYIKMFIGALVMAYVLAHFVAYAQAETVAAGAVTGFWIWLGFVMTASLGLHIFEGRDPRLFWINNGYQLVSLMVIGGLLAAWH